MSGTQLRKRLPSGVWLAHRLLRMQLLEQRGQAAPAHLPRDQSRRVRERVRGGGQVKEGEELIDEPCDSGLQRNAG